MPQGMPPTTAAESVGTDEMVVLSTIAKDGTTYELICSPVDPATFDQADSVISQVYVRAIATPSTSGSGRERDSSSSSKAKAKSKT